mmetsp:Transcript_17785/g.15697  ORF Transcript_17785/g.15697 Transcript_17785/m.15697 type:complete len:169 (-) Transcript_17785:85-591(-)|eukprot:CAMPEP_0205806206 /NCGR_PEP_ID=MMETSP0205-20121125/9652_1 /ASSEMBLY_ACC=CAM_ASM_000278 /TAXON_ID=36767 /ORGANISM="Euplotes focardii, Strain TN1" /LENGTH=168 /DNA_ID=CAMNT_0053078637 /DNA_START=491 /DNA_END=997 /DNA_ORIENTATION=+
MKGVVAKDDYGLQRKIMQQKKNFLKEKNDLNRKIDIIKAEFEQDKKELKVKIIENMRTKIEEELRVKIEEELRDKIEIEKKVYEEEMKKEYNQKVIELETIIDEMKEQTDKDAKKEEDEVLKANAICNINMSFNPRESDRKERQNRERRQGRINQIKQRNTEIKQRIK